MHRIPTLLLSLLFAPCVMAMPGGNPTDGHTDNGEKSRIDTTIVVNEVQVTAIKQGRVLRSEPVASATFGNLLIERAKVNSLKDLSLKVPNLHTPDYGSRMTSSIYVRGLGARIDQPVMGLNVDNIPVMNKDNYDTELADVERIEVLRGPQSTLYGRNTMGGVINVYTLSPLTYQGVRLMAEYSSGQSYRLRASAYQLLRPNLGLSVSGFYTHTGGFFDNLATGAKCDWERMGGGRWRVAWHNDRGLKIDNTFSVSSLKQGGYPYIYIGKEVVEQGQTVIRPGEIRYNDPAGYKRTALSDGLTLRYDMAEYTLSSITSYQYSDDEMTLDQDFQPLSYFTLVQARREHTLSEDLVLRSRYRGRYNWLTGLFGFYRHNRMSAPVTFKRTGIERLIFQNANNNGIGMHFAWDEAAASDWQLPLESDFRNNNYGGAIYHESKFTAGRWHLSAGLRIDVERTSLKYDSRATLPYIFTFGGREQHLVSDIRLHNTLKHTYTEFLPKFSALYAFDPMRNLYISISRGYKAGGFNTQIFSDILQESLKWDMASGAEYTAPDIMSYRPEYSWNYELGGHFTCMDGAVRGDFALFYITVDDQQLTVFPPGQSTGRMMTNAGQTRSFGGEMTLNVSPCRHVDLNAAYGYTNAEFVKYDNGRENFKGRKIPYSPTHTLSGSVSWGIPVGTRWLEQVVLATGAEALGEIYWNEQNTLRQPFYALWNASLTLEHPRYSLSFWGRNLADSRHAVFYFKSMGNEFIQQGRPRTFGMTLNIKL